MLLFGKFGGGRGDGLEDSSINSGAKDIPWTPREQLECSQPLAFPVGIVQSPTAFALCCWMPLGWSSRDLRLLISSGINC